MSPLLFVDTEFTDLVEMDLISMGIVAEDGRSWYAERTDYNQSGCSDFTRSVVLPLLGKRPDRMFTFDAMREDLCNWLAPYESTGAVVCFDYVGDWALFAELLRDVPTWIKSRNVRHQIDEVVLNQYFRDTGLPRHHALYDAMANRLAFRSKE